MTASRRIPFLWALGIAVWVVVTRVLVNVLPVQEGPYSERPYAIALLLGGCAGMSFMVIDLVRQPRRLWLWGLVGGGVVLCLHVLFGIAAKDSDLDQWIGWGVMLGGMVVFGMFGVSFLTWVADRVGKRVQDRPRRWHVSAKGNDLEVTRRKDAPE